LERKSGDVRSDVYGGENQPGGPAATVKVTAATIELADGSQVPGTLLTTESEATEVELLRAVAARLGVRWGRDASGWWATIEKEELPNWGVWRQDDNDNQFLIQANLTETAARAMVAHYESLGHKQMYWAKESLTSD